MHAATCFVRPIFPIKTPIFIKFTSRTSCVVKASGGSVEFEPLSINYNSPVSVFPAEACEVAGGDACEADMYPEAKHEISHMINEANTSTQHFDREYFDYNTDPQSVLRGEACDDLGGEFCEVSYD